MNSGTRPDDSRARRFHALFDSAADAIFLQTMEGRVLEANREACERYGYSVEEFRSLDPNEILAPEFSQPFPDRIETVMRDKRAVFESVHVARDGRRLPIEANVQLVEFDGEPTLLAVCRDISARKKAQAQLQLLEHSIEHSPDPVFWIGPNGSISYANLAATEILGYSREELLRMRIWEIDPAFGPVSVWRDRWKVLAESGPVSVETDYHTRDGRIVPVEVHGRVLQTDGREFIVAVTRDITHRKLAEKEARDTEQRLRTVIDHAPLVLWAIDLDGNFTFSEGSGLRALGLKPGQVVGASIYDLYAGSPRVIEDARRALAGESFRSARSVEGKSYDSHWAPLLDEGGAIVGAIGVAIDVTEQAQLEALLHHSQKMEAVGQLAGGVAHDFNNLLQAIRGYTDLTLESLAPDSAEAGHLRVVNRATEKAVALIRQMLAFSRRERMHPEYLDVDELIHGLSRMLGRVIGEHIDLEVRTGRDAPRIHADPGQIEQVLMNLCVNARDAMPEGGRITIESRLEQFDAPGITEHPWAREGRFACLAVTDTGAGIEPAIQDRIFEPFYTTKEVGQGTGLGLATAYAIVKRHGGWIDVESDLGQGAAFRVFLPCVESTEGDREAAERAEEARGGTETILLAEDEKLVRRWTVEVLERAGYQVVAAEDGEEAIRLLGEHAGEIDLALVDVIMPKRSGREVFQAVREARKDLPVLFTSGYSFEVIDSAYLPDEELNLLQKPYEARELLQKLRELLDG